MINFLETAINLKSVDEDSWWLVICSSLTGNRNEITEQYQLRCEKGRIIGSHRSCWSWQGNRFLSKALNWYFRQHSDCEFNRNIRTAQHPLWVNFRVFPIDNGKLIPAILACSVHSSKIVCFPTFSEPLLVTFQKRAHL